MSFKAFGRVSLLNDIQDQLSVFVLLVWTTGGRGGLTFSMTASSSITIHI